MEIIKQGAEAVIYLDNETIIKKRIEKDYRIHEIDNKLRKIRTKSESKLLQKIDFAPKVFSTDEKGMQIEMEFIKGGLIKSVIDAVEEKKRLELCTQIGHKIGIMHSRDIIHGDLTTSNMILKDNEVFFIDFGLGFISGKIEDKAVDLHILNQALSSKHSIHAEKCFSYLLKGYSSYSKHKEVLERLNKVESRGRYKRRKK